jgi:hypothetical protein
MKFKGVAVLRAELIIADRAEQATWTDNLSSGNSHFTFFALYD